MLQKFYRRCLFLRRIRNQLKEQWLADVDLEDLKRQCVRCDDPRALSWRLVRLLCGYMCFRRQLPSLLCDLALMLFGSDRPSRSSRLVHYVYFLSFTLKLLKISLRVLHYILYIYIYIVLRKPTNIASQMWLNFLFIICSQTMLF